MEGFFPFEETHLYIWIKQDITEITISKNQPKHLLKEPINFQLCPLCPTPFPALQPGACLLGCPSLAVLNCTERWLEGTVPWLSRSYPQGFSRLMGCIPNGHFCIRKSLIGFRISLPSGEPCLILDPKDLFDLIVEAFSLGSGASTFPRPT